MMGFVKSVESLPYPFSLWEMIGIVSTVYLELAILLAVFLSMVTKTPLTHEDQPHMCEISGIVVGIPKKKGSFTIRKSSERRTSFRNRRKNDTSSR
jgi:hypothetical protein